MNNFMYMDFLFLPSDFLSPSPLPSFFFSSLAYFLFSSWSLLSVSSTSFHCLSILCLSCISDSWWCNKSAARHNSWRVKMHCWLFGFRWIGHFRVIQFWWPANGGHKYWGVKVWSWPWAWRLAYGVGMEIGVFFLAGGGVWDVRGGLIGHHWWQPLRGNSVIM